MKLGVCLGQFKDYDLTLYEALEKGLSTELFGANSFAELLGNCDLPVVVGVKSNDAIRFLKGKGQPFLYFDKPYNRKWQTTNPSWWRVSVSDHSPTEYLGNMRCSDRRARQQGWLAKCWRSKGDHILFAGASAKYSAVYGLPEPNAYAAQIIAELKKYTDRRIVYRAKPSWQGAEPVEGAEFVGRARYNITDDLKDCHAMVTHGSGACLEALLTGVPAIVTGPGISRSISSTDLAEIEEPRLASLECCQQILNNLAHCQWSLDEIRKGEMWESLRPIISVSM